MSDFITALHSGKVLLMDGAMGTEIQRLTRPPLTSPQWGEGILSQPDLIRSIHRAYFDAGAEVLLTNTFQANDNHAIWEAGLRIAREAVGDRGFVLADIGPVENLTDEIVSRIVQECRPADGLLLETWSSINAFVQFAQAVGHRPGPAIPVLVSFTFLRDDNHQLTTFTRVSPEECARSAQANGAAALGANCGKDIGMEDLVELVRRYRGECALPIFVRPNAGAPRFTESGWIYPGTPETMADALAPLLEAGAAMVGGCCGTTPEHIRAFRNVIRAWNQRQSSKQGYPSRGRV